jgi:hydroxyethylthiazole kinase-like uncharacterized protein yjeF
MTATASRPTSMRIPEQVLTAAQMRAAEGELVDRGISVDALMQRAGRGAADWIWRIAAGQRVTVLCGPGNNGGDGYVIAETLRQRGLRVHVVAAHAPATDAARNAAEAWRGETISEPPAHGDVLLDCLFGSGLTRALSQEDEALLVQLVASHDFAVAIDLPSGIATDTGDLLGAIPQFDLTLALGSWKPAHFLMPARSRMGQMRRVDIGIEPVAAAARVYPRPLFVPPPADAHKYRRGLVGVVAGAMPGAALLAAEAAMRGGAGYVKLLSPNFERNAPPGLVIENGPLERVLRDERWSALVIGPGLGRGEVARDRLSMVLDRRLPTVIDADALHVLDDDLIEGVDPTRLLVTPHQGELAALCSTFGIRAQGKLSAARELAETTGLTVLAKGPDNILVSPDGRAAFFPAAPSWLSTAGTGDVLAGIAASRFASTGDPFDAAGEAVWLHSEAARRAGTTFTADDLSNIVSTAYARFL